MKFSPAQVVGIALIVDHMNRRNNYHDMVERLTGHIDRWEESIKRLQAAEVKIRNNIRRNDERISKATAFLERMSMQKTWIGSKDRRLLPRPWDTPEHKKLDKRPKNIAKRWLTQKKI